MAYLYEQPYIKRHYPSWTLPPREESQMLSFGGRKMIHQRHLLSGFNLGGDVHDEQTSTEAILRKYRQDDPIREKILSEGFPEPREHEHRKKVIRGRSHSTSLRGAGMWPQH